MKKVKSFNFNIKKIVAYSMMVFVLISLAACKSENNAVKSYLSTKYNSNFSFVSQNEDESGKTYVYEDENKNNFTVKTNGDEIEDNYYHIKFDKQIEEDFSNNLTNEEKLYINTQNNYTGNKQITDYKDYLYQCSDIRALVYTTETNKPKDIVDSIITRLNKETKGVITVSTINKNDFNSINNSTQSDINFKPIYTERCSFGNGLMVW